MKFWGHSTAKPTFVLSNSADIVSLDHGKLKRKQLESEIQTTDRYEAADGKASLQRKPEFEGHPASHLDLKLFFLFPRTVSTFSVQYKNQIGDRFVTMTLVDTVVAFILPRLYPWPYIAKLLEMASNKSAGSNHLVLPEVGTGPQSS